MTDIEWIREALARIETTLTEGAQKCRDRHTILDRDLTEIKIRAGLYGAAAGAVPSILMVVFWIIKH